MTGPKWPSRSLQWAHEYLFALNIVWIVVWLERVRRKELGGHFLAAQVDHLAIFIQRRFPSLSVSAIGGNTVLEQIIWSLALSAIVFFLFRLLAGLPFSKFALETIPGAAAIASFPIASLFFGMTYPACCSETYSVGLVVETIVVLFCAALFYLRKQWVSSPLITVALVLHFTVWAWATSSYVNVPVVISALRSSQYYHPWGRTLGSVALAIAFNCGSPILGFLASLTWVRYLTQTSENHTPTVS